MNTRLSALLPVARDFGSLFGDGFDLLPRPFAWGLDAAAVFPPVNIRSDEQDLLLEAEVPGFGMKELEISVTGDELSIEGERQPLQEEGATHLLRERFTGRFRRTIQLPVPIDAENVRAELHEGVLTIRLPKAAEHRPRRIEVRGSAS